MGFYVLATSKTNAQKKARASLNSVRSNDLISRVSETRKKGLYFITTRRPKKFDTPFFIPKKRK